MKKNIIGLILLAAVAAIAYYLSIEEEPFKGPSNDRDYKDFAIEDTASIDKIFMSQLNGKRITLSRNEEGVWMVNGRFPARVDAINLILKTVHDIKVVGPVSKKTFSGVVKRLASGSTKVEYYQGGSKPSKTWYIGDATANRMGTYMLLEKEGEKSSKPYITHRLMERGYLGTRFFLDPLLWKDRVMMKVDPSQIKKVRIEHAVDSLISFEIQQIAESQFEIENLETEEKRPLSSNMAIPYLKNFSGVYYEYIDLKTSQEELDSVYNSLPRHQILVELMDGKQIEMKTYYLPVNSLAELNGRKISYHPERMYAYTSELGADMHPIVQNLTFDVLVPSAKVFESSTTVEK